MAHSTALTDTIAAIATAVVPAQGSVGIVRLSGGSALAIARQVFQPAGKGSWCTHVMRYGWIRETTGQLIDEALGVWMQSPKSYTREDVVELQCHGGIMVVQATLRLCLQAGARLAQPGEFTLRAFLNGRIDLTQAESIADLIGSYSPEAAQMALAGIRGQLSTSIKQLRSQALNLLAEVEARIDFEDDLPSLNIEEWIRQLAQVQTEIQHLLATSTRGHLLRQGVTVAIVGRPNVGKSSLLNAWSQEDRAIVTDLPGTTRDVVESQLVVKGIPIHLLDTAGIRDTNDVVEKLGVERSYQLAQAADILILVLDASTGWTGAETKIYSAIQHRPVIAAINKTDLNNMDPSSLPSGIRYRVETIASLGVGISRLEDAVEAIAYQGSPSKATTTAINDRHQAALIRAQASFAAVQGSVHESMPLDFWTIDLRGGIHALGEITGEEVTESILDRIFSQFCIGK